jgi:hypothetical protein
LTGEITSRCAECNQFMTWPRQCSRCLGWFCMGCRGIHECPADDYDDGPDDDDDPRDYNPESDPKKYYQGEED